MCCEGKQREDYVFTRDLPNRPIGDFRKLWRNLLKAAGIERKILFHDFRRSSVTNMIERGVDRDVAMQISGHKTPDVFRRYHIIRKKPLTDAALLIQAGAEAERAAAEEAEEERSPTTQKMYQLVNSNSL